jgi:hypothetical protein
MNTRLSLSLAVLLGLSATPALAQDNAKLEARIAAYRHRVELLEDQNAIENLQATYGYYFDKGLWDQAAGLFTRDGSFEYGMRGVYIGQDHIRRAMLLFGPQGLAAGHLNNHMQLQAVITVAPDGFSAKARWQGMIMLARPSGNGIWGVGVYENEYAKQNGVWKISKLHFYVTAKTDYDLGWLKSAIPMEGESALFPPDAPPTEVYRAYPGAYIPPYDYKNPVTGKSLADIPEPPDSVVGRK